MQDPELGTAYLVGQVSTVLYSRYGLAVMHPALPACTTYHTTGQNLLADYIKASKSSQLQFSKHAACSMHQC